MLLPVETGFIGIAYFDLHLVRAPGWLFPGGSVAA